MKGIILAGGKGTRLYPITLETPKPLLTIKKKPILNYIVDLFLYHKIKDITIVISEDRRYNFYKWKKGYYPKFSKIRFGIESSPMGTAGWIYKNYKFSSKNENIIVSNGDEVKDINLTDMINLHKKKKGLITIGLAKVEDPESFGVLECDKNNKVLSFIEKPKNPKTNYINSGTYVINSKAFRTIKPWKNNFLMFEKDIFPKLTGLGQVYAYESKGYFYALDSFEKWEKAKREL